MATKTKATKGDELLYEIHYYHDNEPEDPEAWALFRQEQTDFNPRKWGTWVLDSVTGAVDAAYCEQAYVVNKNGKTIHHRGGVTDQLELHVKIRAKGYPCNTVVTAHVERKFVQQLDGRKLDKRQEGGEEDDGGQIMVRGLSAPGRLGRSGGLGSQFSEVYRAYGYRSKKGARVWGLQTQIDEEWTAKSQINAPDGCEPDYEALWGNFKRKDRPTIHTLVYGVEGTKKSTLAASFVVAGPVYVCMFDGLGMDEPYLRRGTEMGGEIEDGKSDAGVPIKRVWLPR